MPEFSGSILPEVCSDSSGAMQYNKRMYRNSGRYAAGENPNSPEQTNIEIIRIQCTTYVLKNQIDINNQADYFRLGDNIKLFAKRSLYN